MTKVRYGEGPGSNTDSRPSSHVLHEKNITVTLAVIGIAGMGSGILFSCPLIGTAICFVAAVLTISLYCGWPVKNPLERFRRDELAFAFCVVALEIGLPIKVLFFPAKTAASPEAPVVKMINGLWGEDECRTVYRFSLIGAALRIDRLKAPPDAPSYRRIGTVISPPQGYVLNTRADEGPDQGVNTTFTLEPGGVPKLAWQDRNRGVVTVLTACSMSESSP